MFYPDEPDELNQMVRSIMQEIVTIAEKKAVQLPGNIIEISMKKANNFPYDVRTSYQRDVESFPKPNEGDLYGGSLLREGLDLGIPTPATKMVYSRILQFEGKV